MEAPVLVDASMTEAMPSVSPREPLAPQDTPPVPARVKSETGQAARVVDLLRGTNPGDTQPLDPVRPPVVEARPLAGRPVLYVTLAGLLLGAIVGVVGAIGVFRDRGEDAPTPTTELVAFDQDVYREQPVPLEAATVTATSSLPPAGDNHYEPTLVLDQDPTTAWNSDGSVRADGVGEVLTVQLAEPAWVTSIEFANGYQKDDVRFLANARIARASLVFDDGRRVNIVLLDKTGFQRVALEEPMLSTSVRVEVVEVFTGDTYHDLAVSEVIVLGHVAVGDDRERAIEIAAQS